jgi:hypothetical protein
MKQDFARSVSDEAISPKQPEFQIINLHGLYEKPVEIASPPTGGSQNQYFYYT